MIFSGLFSGAGPKRPSLRPAIAGLALVTLAACSPGPDVVFPPGPTGEYPHLVPIDALLAQADAPAS